MEFGKNSQEPPSSRVEVLSGVTNSTISQGSFMPNSHNTFKAQSITTTTTTTIVSSTSSKLITTNAIMPSRVSIIFNYLRCSFCIIFVCIFSLQLLTLQI